MPTLRLVLVVVLCLIRARGQDLHLQARVSKPANVILSGRTGQRCVQAFQDWDILRHNTTTHQELLDPLSALRGKQAVVGEIFPLGDNVLQAWLSQFGQVRYDFQPVAHGRPKFLLSLSLVERPASQLQRIFSRT
jgi:hypothetical protein